MDRRSAGHRCSTSTISISNFRPSSCVEFKNNNKCKKFIKFNNGICSACTVHIDIKPNINWEERKELLDKLLDSLRSNKVYDIIIPASGGKDSTYACYILKKIHNAKCLSVTWSPHIYTIPGFKNFQPCPGAHRCSTMSDVAIECSLDHCAADRPQAAAGAPVHAR